ncbi:ABC-2 family transporter protein [Streptomyces sp. MNU76]|uniref:ABC transporter permease n=1 Tax=Streptomyces sp. MNU76 TaxID=2560026 RepID=UPI001E5CEB7A|nr:ABC-2 family transporter protein [Streptomyces sp. MNU76]MCC9711776.1 ABC-2 family transporter protein [Streptomyces sp. MNU76]
MAAVSSTAAVASAVRVARITPLGEFLAPPRITANLLRIVVQTVLVVALWRGLYADVGSGTMAGLTREQAVSYAVLAVLATRVRGLDRSAARDTVIQHLHFGTIVYWFLRPISPRRYYALRALGDQIYGLLWLLTGYAACLAAGVARPPATLAVAGVATLSLLLGQWVLYYVMLLIDLLCFWTLRNQAALLLLVFAQNLLSGVYAPLWYFPDWFITVSAFLPFQATLAVPLSLYVGRLPLADALPQLALQVGWVVLLAVLTRMLWHRAARRVVSQGG